MLPFIGIHFSRAEGEQYSVFFFLDSYLQIEHFFKYFNQQDLFCIYEIKYICSCIIYDNRQQRYNTIVFRVFLI